MKKFFVFASMAILSLVLTYCSASKKAAKAPPKTTYTAVMTSVIANKCSPCHIPPKGNKKAYDNYANVKTDIDEMIRRIELNPGDRGFMPFRGNKVSADTIAIFKKFKEDGLLEN